MGPCTHYVTCPECSRARARAKRRQALPRQIKDSDVLAGKIVIASPYADALLAVLAAARELEAAGIDKALRTAIAEFDALAQVQS